MVGCESCPAWGASEVLTVPASICPGASGWGSWSAATFRPGWWTGRSAPSPQRSFLSCTYLWRTGTSAGSQTPGTGPAASECRPHLWEGEMQPSGRSSGPARLARLSRTHGKAVVCEGSSTFVLLVELFFAADGMFHKVHRLQEEMVKTAAREERREHKWKGPWTDQGGNNHVEVPQVHVLGRAELRGKYRHQHLEVLCPLCRVAGQVPQHWI